MEERRDLQGNVTRQSSLRPGGNLKSTLSGRSTPRGSPSFKRLGASRTPRRETRSQWLRNNSVLLWLILITLWCYLGFYVQSKWAHGDNNKPDFVGYQSRATSNVSDGESSAVLTTDNYLVLKNGTGKSRSNLENVNASLVKKGGRGSSRRSMSTKKRKRSTVKGKQRGIIREKVNVVADGQNDTMEEQEEETFKSNTTYGLIVGPFTLTEDRILEWSAEKRSGTCDRKGDFRRLVWSRNFVLIFHELSITGAPLSMMELATELLSCGATVSAVVLSKRGGLMPEMARRRIKIIEDKDKLSFKAAMKADLIIAGSAVCSSWIEQYLEHFTAGSSQIVWWIMENRREYFDRSKLMLRRVKLLVFLSESQSKQWLAWCQEEDIKLYVPPALIPLSVNDELAFVAGIPCSLNTPSYSVEKMLEKRKLLREAVRNEMGLTENDMLVISLSSINPGKGQLLLLESARLIIEGKKDNISGNKIRRHHSSTSRKKKSRALFQHVGHIGESENILYHSDMSSGTSNNPKKNISILPDRISSNNHTDGTAISRSNSVRKVLSTNEGTQEHSLKVLVGSLGSKSNKVFYVNGLLGFLSNHSDLSKAVLWTPATTHVASLYSAADVYVINSQGLGETFGRVTIEAMAYGLPVLGTDAGGTREIVEHNVTGLLHPLGRPGTETLARNLVYFLESPDERKQMGMRGREKVDKMYLKRHMYKKFAEIMSRCMRPK